MPNAQNELEGHELSALFPVLTDYENKSSPTPAYNCMAWAVEVTNNWWEPAHGPGYFWPPTAPFDYSTASAIRAYEAYGFHCCDSGALEDGFEKIAVYGDGTDYTHAARQLASGKWTSKIGQHQDLEHPTAESLEGPEYGHIECFMKRPRPTPPPSPTP
jgi:hypothetical protein